MSEQFWTVELLIGGLWLTYHSRVPMTGRRVWRIAYRRARRTRGTTAPIRSLVLYPKGTPGRCAEEVYGLHMDPSLLRPAHVVVHRG